jgi:hypothetical protein
VLRVDVEDHAVPLERVDDDLDPGRIGSVALPVRADHVVVVHPHVLLGIGASSLAPEDGGYQASNQREQDQREHTPA